jgi:hypothetical protein
MHSNRGDLHAQERLLIFLLDKLKSILFKVVYMSYFKANN